MGRATVDEQGAFSVVVTHPARRRPVVLRVEATDEGGATAVAERRFTIDLGTQVAVSQPASAAVLDEASPELSGTGEPGARNELWVDGQLLGTAVVGADGRWVFPLPAPLGDGPHVVEVRSTDAAGNQAESRREFRVDTRRLELHNPPDRARLRDGAVTVSGVARPGALVSVMIDRVLIDTLRATGAGSWSLQLITTLAEGPHTVQVTTTSELRVTTGSRPRS